MKEARPRPAPSPLKMSDLVRESGVSKELVHHYLREGLLPRPSRRALYGEQHVRLLGLVKRLRDERFLPLPVIREIVASAQHDPDRVEVVLLSGSEMTAAAAQTASPRPADERLSRADLEARAGASSELVGRCIEVGLIVPTGDRFGAKDANVLALVRHGTAMGIPLDSFRTIASYVEMAFELERALFMPGVGPEVDLDRIAREVAVRKELANAFVANVLSRLIDREVASFVTGAATEARMLQARFYRPSEAFLRKHGVLTEIDSVRARLHARPRDAALLRRLVSLLSLAGRHRELAFVLEQRHAATEGDGWLLGHALLMVGEVQRSIEVLERARAKRPRDAVVLAFLAAARFHDVGASARVEVTLPALGRAAALADSALDLTRRADTADAARVRLACGWVLASMPAGSPLVARGLRELEAAYGASAGPATRRGLADAARLRDRISSATLLHRALERDDLPAALAKGAAARREALLAEVLRLDPASEIALELFARGGSQ